MPNWLWIQNVVFPILGMGMGVLFMVGAYKTMNRWLDRRHERALAEQGGMDAGVQAALDRLSDRVAQLEDTSFRIQELEERLDFTERVLAQHRPPPELPSER